MISFPRPPKHFLFSFHESREDDRKLVGKCRERKSSLQYEKEFGGGAGRGPINNRRRVRVRRLANVRQIGISDVNFYKSKQIALGIIKDFLILK